MAADPALARLNQIRHIVLVMMQGRSFDQMLGYLRRDGLLELNGLSGEEVNLDGAGKPVPVFQWGPRAALLHPPPDHTSNVLVPASSRHCVGEQLAEHNGGFVKNFLATRTDSAGSHVALPAPYRRLPMGYYAREHLPTYDFLARNFCVCDAWHSSVPDGPWPNRSFALAARAPTRAPAGVPSTLRALLSRKARLRQQAPIADVQAFTRQLQDEQWRSYSHAPATLRALDARYRRFGARIADNFAFFDRQRSATLTRALHEPSASPDSFLDDCSSERLRAVSQIDPDFLALRVLEASSSGDHVPADVRAGQAFVLEIYEALRASSSWQDTLLVVLYDSHGGFYDHVAPPALPFDDGSGYGTYGVRVPALVVGPRVARGVCHETFEHTSLIKTILLRFASEPEQAIARMGPRVAHAPHLGAVLLDDPRSDIPEPEEARQAIDAWLIGARASRRGSSAMGYSTAPDGAGQPFVLHDFQQDFVRFALAMYAHGLPPGQP